MKKSLFILAVLITVSSYSQKKYEVVERQNEITLNAFNLIAAKWIDVSYEKILNDESSLGVSFLTRVGNHTDFKDWGIKSYSVTPYYRQYFSPYYAAGFFMEAFAMYNGGERKELVYNAITDQKEKIVYKDVAFGIGLGQKFISRRGFVGVAYAGLGRNMFDTNAPVVVGRAGISFGFRF